MITRSQWLGIHVLAATALTLVWLFLCPKFQTSGQLITSSTSRQYLDRKQTTWTNPRHVHLDLGYFVGGEVVIWGASLGLYLLRRPDAAQPPA